MASAQPDFSQLIATTTPLLEREVSVSLKDGSVKKGMLSAIDRAGIKVEANGAAEEIRWGMVTNVTAVDPKANAAKVAGAQKAGKP